MTEPKLAKPRRNYIYAALSAAVGAYFLAVGLGLFPIPGGPSNLHGPLWLLACAGLAFFLAGIAIAFQTLGQANAAGDLSAAAPRWMRALQYLIGLAIFCCFGAIATWMAFGPGERQFSGTFLFFDPATNAAIGAPLSASARVMIWLCTVAVAAAGFRKLLAN
jgi:hypothetical protein